MPLCKQCGSSDVYWKQIDEKWRLHNADGQPHFCNKVFEPIQSTSKIINAPPLEEPHLQKPCPVCGKVRWVTEFKFEMSHLEGFAAWCSCCKTVIFNPWFQEDQPYASRE